MCGYGSDDKLARNRFLIATRMELRLIYFEALKINKAIHLQSKITSKKRGLYSLAPLAAIGLFLVRGLTLYG